MRTWPVSDCVAPSLPSAKISGRMPSSTRTALTCPMTIEWVPKGTTVAMSQNRLHCAPSRYGMPDSSLRHSPVLKRSSPLSLPLNAVTRSSCSVVSTLTQKRPRPISGAWMLALWFTQISSDGGSMASEFTAVAVMP